ncbi:mechanosensitive ion channel family protein [Halieaceae bacterium IMCC14734]|uniref:Small-conductance mechanosensitive channel n=1 Tax=Candidatus Litorirhabdus singularis TaxID=2518993 RepID=A0ABT3TDE2_9GAMM|nr:mechanosensitive ion channel family protein [Candidatus Litorirhabdus singularis]MCX2980205.1 mechanosensitive ion channel family protein [Candidatus Litorirhabdus singularis]
MQNVLQLIEDLFPALGIAITTFLVITVLNLVLRRGREGKASGSSTTAQFISLVLAAFALVGVIVLLPITDETQGQILSLLGVILTAVIALSATTFVANAMAGLMLQSSGTIRTGDYVRVNGEFGRVTKRNLLQTKIQTELRDITTLPNILLVNNPLTVLHRDGTVIAADLSLGYDIPYPQVETLLTEAAEAAGLEDPFVLVQELLDHAVSYRVAGFLAETRNLITARSNLRKKALEMLHGHGVEIVSPSFMNQRALDPTQRVIPAQPVLHSTPQTLTEVPEERIFDKAEEATNQEQLQVDLDTTKSELKELKAELKNASDDEQVALEQRVSAAEAREIWLKNSIEQSKPD